MPAIAVNEAGVTRDRVYQKAEWCGRQFDAVDTGGLLFEDEEGALFLEEIREQATLALQRSAKSARAGGMVCRKQDVVKRLFPVNRFRVRRKNACGWAFQIRDQRRTSDSENPCLLHFSESGLKMLAREPGRKA